MNSPDAASRRRLALRYVAVSALAALLAFELAAEIGTVAWLGGVDGRSPWLAYGPHLLPPLLMLLVGAWIGLARPRDGSALRVSFLLLTLGQALTLFADRAPVYGVWPPWALGARIILSRLAICPLAFLVVDVLAAFPNPSPLGTWLRKRTWILFPYALLSLESALEAARRILGAAVLPDGVAAALDRALPWRHLWLALLAIAVVLVAAQRVATRRRREVRLGIVEAGLVGTALGGAWVLFLWRSPLFWRAVEAPEGPLLSAVLRVVATFLPVLLLCAFPLTLAYAVAARRVFDIRVFVRQGLRYVLLSRGVLLVEGVLLFLILGEAIHLGRREAGASLPALTAAAGIAAALAALVLARLNRRVMRAIDRRFFREAYDSRRLLLGLGRDMLTLRERQDVLRRTAAALLDTLHATRVGFFLRDPASGEARLAWDDRSDGGEPPGPSTTAAVEEGLEAFEDGGWSWDIPEAGAPGEEGGSFRLLVALRGNTGLLGCIALGAKRSGEPYGRDDRETLATVAAQVGLALENAALLDVARREAEQARELSIARRVQEGLFPAGLPAPEAWEFAAVCRPARAVGGDYYDVLAPDSARVVVALGDVSGKGLGPALLMSGVQALVRSRLRRPGTELTELVAELSEHIRGSSSEGTFVTLFVGVLDTESGRLRYVNAGHNPPLVVAADGREDLLTEGGLPAGMLEDAQYAEGETVVEPGAVLVVTSDGVTEARNRAGEFYGEESLRREVAAARAGGAGAVLAAVLASVDRFAQGEEQSDDLSLLVASRRPTP